MHPVIALNGFGLTGVGGSAAYPLAISAAARRTDRAAPVNVAALAQKTFIVLFAIRFSNRAVVPAAILLSKALAPPAASIAAEPVQTHG
ncbi:hypothetical protein H4W29_004182 [Rhizobium viscosum]|uniref:Uncharacterized protein n=1 Tax=Rhizobium viscosum TaxID=1673 RepID=A0ABR9IUY3_RHIVS|nr:hypothetical protein [Rhizobium viscosum]